MTQPGSRVGLNPTSLTESRATTVRKAPPEDFAVVEIPIREVERMCFDLADIKPQRRWRGLAASALSAVAITALFTGLAGIHHATVPLPWRVGYFVAAAFSGLGALGFLIVDVEDRQDPVAIANKVRSLLDERVSKAVPADATTPDPPRTDHAQGPG
jgi:hypothetical protein